MLPLMKFELPVSKTKAQKPATQSHPSSEIQIALTRGGGLEAPAMPLLEQLPVFGPRLIVF